MSIVTICPENLRKISEEDYVAAAKELQTGVAEIKTVIEVEAAGDGFQKDGKPKILFEAHLFGYFTGYKFNDKKHLSCRTWDEAKPYYNMDQHARFEEACALDLEAACKSSSWGYMQICGFNAVNYKLYPTAVEYVKDMCRGGRQQLLSFVAFCKATGLDKKLRDHDWAGFAYGYNGPLFNQNKYDVKLAQAFARHSGWLMVGTSGPKVVALQKALGLSACDGAYGPITQQAVRDFQGKKGLPQTGVADTHTQKALGLN